MTRLGIAGGLGPLASALFYERVTRLTRVSTDQEHAEIVLYSAPFIPDRSAFLCGSGASPYPALLKVCRVLESLTDVIAIPCMTAHHFYENLSDKLSVPVIDMHGVCAAVLKSAGMDTVGIMATEGTLVSGRLVKILNSHGIKTILPAKQDAVTGLIYGIKAGKTPDNAVFESIASSLASQGAQACLLACTELSLFGGVTDCPPLYDSLELLARHCVETLGGTLID